ncbi:MAG: cell division regulator GpsB [Bacilli bacterium]
MFNDRIGLTPQDIYEKEFKIDTRGYRLQEVDKFLDQVIKDHVEFINIIKELKHENKEISEENATLKHELHKLRANIDIVKNSEKEITNVDVLRRLSQLEKYIYDNDK